MLGNNKFQFIPGFILRMGGGCAADAQGGSLLGLSAHTRNSSNPFIGLNFQYVIALQESFGYQGVFHSLGKQETSHSLLNWQPVFNPYLDPIGLS
jgi:hypothetical protein